MFDIIFSFIVMHVHSLNYISAAINMFKLKQKEAPCLIYFVCKYSKEDCSSQGELTDVMYSAVCTIIGLASFRPRDSHSWV